MAVELRELVLRAVVDARPGAAPAPTTAPPPSPSPAAARVEHEALVERCVREVLRALRDEHSR